jgi:uncharacterized membrane protein YtjA (UPF0391 family)
MLELFGLGALPAGLSHLREVASHLLVLPRAWQEEENKMLYYALVFLLVALIAGALGFGFVAFAAAGIAKFCFFIFLVMFLVSLFMHIGRGASRSI